MEAELSSLHQQLKMTSGPNKQALEHLKKKIETQNQRVAGVRRRYEAAKQVG